MRTLLTCATLVLGLSACVYSSPNDAPQQAAGAGEKRMRDYDRQMARSAEMLARNEAFLGRAEEQQKRMEAVVSRWEKQADRYDALLDRWERQGHRD